MNDKTETKQRRQRASLARLLCIGVLMAMAAGLGALSPQTADAAAPRGEQIYSSLWRYEYARLWRGPGDLTIKKDCPGCDLSDRSYNGWWMPGVNFAGAKVDNVDFDNATMYNANLSNVWWQANEFSARYADLSGANLSGAEIALAEMREVDLSGATLTNAQTYEVKWEDAVLDGVDLRWASGGLQYAPGASFVGADLREADFGSATLGGTNFTNAQLEDTNLSSAVLNDADLTGATGTPNAGGAWYSNTTCPDGTNTDANGGTCTGHWLP